MKEHYIMANNGTFRKPFLFRFLSSFLISLILFNVSAQAGKVLKILPLGDSITSGKPLSATYRYWLWRKLVDAGYAADNPVIEQKMVDFIGLLCGAGDDTEPPECGDPLYPNTEWDWEHEGRSGQPTTWLHSIVPLSMDNDTADIVMLHIGTNDIHLGYSLDVAKTTIGMIIDTIRSRNPYAVILLAKIIPSTLLPEKFPILNEKIGEIAVEKNTSQSPIILVDQYEGYDASDDNSDGSHPNESGEKKIAQKWYDALIPVLDSICNPQVTITNPSVDSSIEISLPFTFEAKFNAYFGMKKIVFFAGHSAGRTYLGKGTKISDSTVNLPITPSSAGTFSIYAEIEDSMEQKTVSDTITVTVFHSTVYSKSISEIQGSDTISPYNGNLVRTVGTVTSFSADSSVFWIQDSTGITTAGMRSNGILVHCPIYGNGKSKPKVSDLVKVKGRVQEYRSNQNHQTITRITNIDSIIILNSNYAVPSPAVISFMRSQASDMPYTRDLYEAREGMLVKLPLAVVSAPTGVDGEFAVIPNQNLPPNGPTTNTLWCVSEASAGTIDYQTESIIIGRRTLTDTINVRPGDLLVDLWGIVDYEQGYYKIQPIEGKYSIFYTTRSNTPPITEQTSNVGTNRITSFNLHHFFDTIDDAGKDDIVIASDKFLARCAKTRKAFIQEMQLPNLVCIQEVENQQTLQSITESINSIEATGYKALSLESGDPSGLENGFVYDSLLFTCDSLFLMETDKIDSSFGAHAEVRWRKPIVGVFSSGIIPKPLIVINIDLLDKTNDEPVHGVHWPLQRPSEVQRMLQATAIRNWIDDVIADPNAYLVVAGSMNDYIFNEHGETETPIAKICGNGSTGTIQLINTADSYSDPYSNFTKVSEGTGKRFDFILLSTELYNLAQAARPLHFNAGFEANLQDDTTTTIRCSDRDPVEVRF